MNITIQTSSLEGCQLKNILAEETGYCVTRQSKISLDENRSKADLLIIESRSSVSLVLNQIIELREIFDKAIILLGPSGDVSEKIIALEMGVDEYIKFPCNSRELIARIKNVSKWIDRIDSNDNFENKKTLNFVGWELSVNRRYLKHETGLVYSLTHKEYLLLFAFLRNVNEILSRDFLLKEIYKRDWSPSDRTIDILVGKLRKKLEVDGGGQDLINTVYGVGYIFSLDT